MNIKRALIHALRAHLEQKEITLLVGSRQAGKTTLLKALDKELENKGEQRIFLNLDYEPDNDLFESQERFIRYLKLKAGIEKAYIFIDEIQRKENAGLFLKGIYDQELPYKFIVSGSGSLELKEKIHESLAGRKRLFELETVSFSEFANYKTDYEYEGKLKEYIALVPDSTKLLLLEYLNFGGYPRVVTSVTAEQKNAVLREIYQSYLEKDLIRLLQIEKSQSFTDMVRLLALRIGQPLDYSNLSRDVGLSFTSLKKYLWYAEKTFILELIPPFFRNKEKEIVKAPQAYYKDIGIRNISIEQAGRIQRLNEAGFEFQNFVYRLLRSYIGDRLYTLHYWRTKSQAEVDFVIDQGHDLLPVEVKAKALKRTTISRSFRSFINTYEPREAWVVNLSLEASIEVENTKVYFLPWWKLVEE